MTPELNSAISKAAEEKYPKKFRYNKNKKAAGDMVTERFRQAYTAGATDALTNPDLYEKAGLVKREEWISVEDKLPKNHLKVLTISLTGLLIGKMLDDKWTLYYSDGFQVVATSKPVTHWMPLPNKPQQ